MEGKIVKGIAGFYYVDTPQGVIWQCKAKGIFRSQGLKPLAGDDVVFEITHEGDREGNITEIVARRNALIRPPVANIDQALVLFAMTKPEPSLYLLDRFLIMMEKLALPVRICFNKRDLSDDAQEARLKEVYRSLEEEVLFISAEKREGLDALREVLYGKTTALAGPSGVGKSTLINALLPGAETQTGAVSEKIGRGRNTTRHTEIFRLGDLTPAWTRGDTEADEPEASGIPAGETGRPETGRVPGTERPAGEAKATYLMDTPGFTSLDLSGVEAQALHTYYPDFAALADGCRFHGCIHLTEPDCAVKDALAQGAIAQERYDNYRLLYDEIRGERPVYVKKIKTAPGGQNDMSSAGSARARKAGRRERTK